MFLPTTPEEFLHLGWEKADILLVSGDTYIDSPYNGAAVIGKLLMEEGYKVGIIAQPAMEGQDITRLGEPALFWGITGGAMDSMVANYTAAKKFRKQDDLTPGGENNRRPDRAVIQYANLIRRHFKETAPLVLGGIEASLRRITHYDFWSNKIRNSILPDAKGDILIYGMGEKTVLALAAALKRGKTWQHLGGLCYMASDPPQDYLILPAAEEVKKSHEAFSRAFTQFYNNNDPLTARGLVQQHGKRWLVHNPPADYETPEELDYYYNLPFELEAHPYYNAQGKIRALDTIRYSVTTHRGCYGECNFCAIALHQGRRIRSRSEASILKEIQALTKTKGFKGIINDLGGATANMYNMDCTRKQTTGSCRNKRCLFPALCRELDPDHSSQIRLLKKARQIQGIKKIFIASGIRHDLILNDKKAGKEYLRLILRHHISGQMKIAPEHINPEVLRIMGKPGNKGLEEFKQLFDSINRDLDKKQFLTYYFIAAHPGCSQKHMEELKNYIRRNLKLTPEQVQIFTPTPSTYSTLFYYTGFDPRDNKKIFVEKDPALKNKQKQTVTSTSRN